MFVMMLAGWVNEQHRAVNAYLKEENRKEENRVLRELHGHKRLRFVLSITSECVDRMVMLGERHLRRAVARYMAHYHLERCHQGIGSRPIEGVRELASGPVERTERLGGILSHYYRRAA